MFVPVHSRPQLNDFVLVHINNEYTEAKNHFLPITKQNKKQTPIMAQFYSQAPQQQPLHQMVDVLIIHH